ncbi:unnamed protein product [Ixodes pacificus]
MCQSKTAVWAPRTHSVEHASLMQTQCLRSLKYAILKLTNGSDVRKRLDAVAVTHTTQKRKCTRFCFCVFWLSKRRCLGFVSRRINSLLKLSRVTYSNASSKFSANLC